VKRTKRKAQARKRRHRSVRRKVFGTPERPRLCVFRSLRHVYAQVVDDVHGRCLVAASTLTPELRPQCEGAEKTQAAALVGKEVARRAIEAGIQKIAFDRGGYKYHGRVRALAEAAREGGLEF
jgi:large subunit ribosomal protein L18